jgi:hypothetical protein
MCRVSTVLLLLVALPLSACNKTAKAEPAKDSFKTDHVSPTDGVLAKDGKNDAALTFTVDGPIQSIVVLSVDEKSGAASGGQQWDTLVGNDVVPKESGSMSATGAATWQLGVSEGGTFRNNGAGSLSPLGDGTHELTLYLSDNSQLRTLHYVAVAIRPDGKAVRSNLFKF